MRQSVLEVERTRAQHAASSRAWLAIAASLVVSACAADPVPSTRDGQGQTISCNAGLTDCGGTCRNTQSDPLACGACFQSCSGPCNAGVCNGTLTPTAGVSGGTGVTSGAGSIVIAGNGSGGINGGMSGMTGAGVGASGTTGAGSSGMSSAGNGSAGTSGPSGFGGYIVRGTFKGYAWTAAPGNGSSITPADFASVQDFPLCAAGTVAAGDENVAMVGWNLNQATTAGAPTEAITLTQDAIEVRVTNNAGSPLRLQVQAADGGTNANARWCAALPANGGVVPLSQLNTECWAGGAGMPYAGQPITAAMVLVPGRMGEAVSFDFCIDSLTEASASDAGSGGAGGDSGAGGSGGMDPGSGKTYPPIASGCDGFATRYWDCCKPHCGWSGNVSGFNPLGSCTQSDDSYGGNYDVGSACSGGGAFMCHNLAPWADGDRLAYGYTAVSHQGDICGRCYQLEFTGQSHNGGADPGSAAISGKTMIVQAINIGGDVGSSQFDIMIPGGGVGAFNACSSQWGISSSELGAQYGGLLSRCKQSGGNDHSQVKSCVMQACDDVFGSRGLTELHNGCRWFVEWFQVADNPSLRYQEIPCPSELTSRGMNRTNGNMGACL